MPVRNFAIAATLVLLCFAPLASAKEPGLSNPFVSTPTTLFFHAFDAQNDFPMNTQEPDASWDHQGYRVGSATNSLCFNELSDPDPPVGQPMANKEYHTFYGYSSPSYVEYDFLQNGKPRVHPERGLSFDVELDDRFQPILHWYLATHSGVDGSGAPEDPNQVPVPVPNVIVRGTMRESDSISLNDAGYRDGAIIMQGQSEPATLAGPATSPGVNWTVVDKINVYEIKVPLTMEANAIPRATGYNFQVEVFIDNPRCTEEGDYIMPNVVDLHTSVGHRPRVDLAVMNPIRIEYLHPQFVGDELVIHSALNSPWGNYDVDESSFYNGFDGTGITIKVLDAAGEPVAGALEQVAFIQRYHEHDHHQEAVDATYLWNYQAVGAANGVYTVELEAWNDQRTAVARGVGQFEIGDGNSVTGCGAKDITQEGKSASDLCETEEPSTQGAGGRGAPGLAPVLCLLAALGAAMVARRKA